MNGKRIRVLIVEDSPLYADVLAAALSSAADIDVVGVAEDGRQAVTMATSLTPDLITMDLQLPKLSGLDAVSQIMAETPCPILVITGTDDAEGRMSFEALRRGALDLIHKPSSAPLPRDELERLLARVRKLAATPVLLHPKRLPARARRAVAPRAGLSMVGVVASTGGPAALASLLGGLPAALPFGIVVVQHITPGFTVTLAGWLDRQTPMRVRVATEGVEVGPGDVWLAPDGCEVWLTALGALTLSAVPAGAFASGDHLLEDIARVFGPRGAGVVLTGMGRDGTVGLAALNAAGGLTLVQDPDTAVVRSMPTSAAPHAAHAVSIPEIARWLCDTVRTP